MSALTATDRYDLLPAGGEVFGEHADDLFVDWQKSVVVHRSVATGEVDFGRSDIDLLSDR